MTLDHTLSSFVERMGYVRLQETVSRELEIAKVISKHEGEDIIRFKLESMALDTVGNVVDTRSKLYAALGVRDDLQAYTKLLTAINASRRARSLSRLVEPSGFDRCFKELPLEELEAYLPVAKYYEGDGGRYLTSTIVIARDPEDPEVYNASVHRMMWLGGSRFAVRLVPRHLYNMHARSGESGLPVAVITGVHPVVLLAASTSVEYGLFELHIAAELLGGLRVTITPKYELPVPTASSVVMEGRLLHERVKEGPFVDVLGLYDEVRMEPVLSVERAYVNECDEALAHAILPGGAEHRILMGFPREAMIFEAVSKVVPRVHGVRLTPASGSWLHAVISVDKNSDGDAKNAIMAAFSAHPSLKHVVVVDPDVNIDDPHDIEWSIATRFQADRDLVIVTGARGSTLDPSSKNGITAKVGIDATAPIKERHKYSRARCCGGERCT